jgi:rhamnose transport system substrate-binding protein
MKIRSPQNSTLTTLPPGMVRFPSVSAEANNFPSIAWNGARRYLSLASAFLAIAPLLITGSTTARAAGADNFELAMVIKETTNPYYNATLSGARIAAGEIGGTANNYGPTQSSGQAQVELINNLADRHIAAIAVAASDPDAVVPAMKRAQKLGAKVVTFDADSAPDGRPFFVNQSTSDAIGRYGAKLLVEAMGPKGKVATTMSKRLLMLR